MKDALSYFFAEVYEVILGLYSTQFVLIFQSLYEEGSYIWLGIIFILAPLIMSALFYFVWKYPYGRLWHWVLWWLFICLCVVVVTWRVAENEIFNSNWQPLNDALSNPDTGYDRYATTLPIKYALYNGILALALGFIYSLILKRWSKVQIHLPF